MPSSLTYLLLMLGTVFFPLLLSFDKRVQFYKKWNYLFIPIVLTSSIFIIWDIYFTNLGVWKFNTNYIMQYYCFNLPIEEVLFFIIVPFACIFIYECITYYFNTNSNFQKSKSINIITIAVLSLLFIFNTTKYYTAYSSGLAIVLLLILHFYIKPNWIINFYIAYLVSLIPFLIVNGLLTSLPVVIYNDTENLGIRIFSIPIEDTIYCFELLLMNIIGYEYLKSKKLS